MGWNTTVVLAEHVTAEQIEAILPDVFFITTTSISWEDASSSRLAPNLAFGHYQDWALIYDPNAKFAYDERIITNLSQYGRTFVCTTHSVASVYGFYYAMDGQILRKVMRQDSTLVENDGNPLPEEQQLNWDDEEDAIFELAQRVTGLNLTDSVTLGSIPFTLIELDL